MQMIYLRASGLPSALSSPPASPEQVAMAGWPARLMAGRRKVLKQKNLYPVKSNRQLSAQLTKRIWYRLYKVKLSVCRHLTGAVYPWPKRTRGIFAQTGSMPSWHYAHITSRQGRPWPRPGFQGNRIEQSAAK